MFASNWGDSREFKLTKSFMFSLPIVVLHGLLMVFYGFFIVFYGKIWLDFYRLFLRSSEFIWSYLFHIRMVRIYRYTFETATLIWGIYNEYGYKAISINHELLFTCFFFRKICWHGFKKKFLVRLSIRSNFSALKRFDILFTWYFFRSFKNRFTHVGRWKAIWWKATLSKSRAMLSRKSWKIAALKCYIICCWKLFSLLKFIRAHHI